MMHIIFIRHAQSTWNEARRWQGHANPPLAEKGREQARLLARRLSSWKIDQVYSSDLTRAVETAQILGESIGIQPTIDAIWRERGFGALEGLTAVDIEARYPEVWSSRMLGPIIGVDGAEPQDEVIARAASGVKNLLERHPEQTVAVVSHGGMILTTLVYLLGLPPSGHAMLTVGNNTAISRVSIDGSHVRLVSLNDSAHLELLAEESTEATSGSQKPRSLQTL